jgi:hypothetical protein
METDGLARRRNRLVVLNATGFVLWQASSFQPHLAGPSGTQVIVAIGLAAFALWAVSFALLLRPVADARSRAVLDDELTRHNQLQAFLAGYWAMLFLAAAGLALTSFVPLPAVLVLRVLVIVGVAAPLLRFVVLERRVGGD